MKIYEIIPSKLLPQKKNAPQELARCERDKKAKKKLPKVCCTPVAHTYTRTGTHTQSGVAPKAHQALP